MGVYDFKYGAGIFVSAIDNWQLELYGIGALNLIDNTVDTVEVGIIQPRIPSTLGRCRSEMYHRDDLRKREEFFKSAMLNQTRQTDFSPSDEACQWCRAKPVCDALKDKCLKDAALWFGDGEPTRESIEEHAVEKPAELSMDARTAILHNVELIRAWLKSVEAHALEIALDGTEIPGFKIVQGTGGQRKWREDQEAMFKMFAGKKINKTDITKQVLLGPAPVEKLCKKLVKTKKLSKVQFDRIMGHAVKPPGKRTLVPAADERPAVVLTAEQMFD
jgi:hypothetical protein